MAYRKTSRMPRVQHQVQRSARRSRRPQVRFYLEQKPFAIQPFCCAPVLAGESLNEILVQARVVTDPIKNKLIGWWAEFGLFYVPFDTLTAFATIKAALLDPTTNLDSLNGAAVQAYNHAANSIDWTQKCLKPVVEEYFRASGELDTDYLINSRPAASVNLRDGLDSLVKETDYATGEIGRAHV